MIIGFVQWNQRHEVYLYKLVREYAYAKVIHDQGSDRVVSTPSIVNISHWTTSNAMNNWMIK